MEKVDARDDGSSLISTMKMTLIDKNGKKRNRQMRTFSKDINANTEHKTIFFLSPSDVKNTAFLTYDYSADDKDDDQWMYLPALKKTKRIPASDKDVWKIESTPISQAVIDETGYTKSTLYIRKDNYVLTRAKFYLKKGSRVKYMDVRKLEEIDGIWVAMQTTMTTKQGKKTLHKTILTNSDVEINKEINDDIFTVRTIEKGL